MSQFLTGLGFLADEIHACDTYRDGTIIITCGLAGEPARLSLDTGRRAGLVLSHGYVRARGLPYEREGEKWGTTSLEHAVILGATHSLDSIPVFGAASATEVYHTVGWLGIGFLQGHVLAIDPLEWKLGLTARGEVRESFGRARHRVPLLPGIAADVPVTSALVDRRSQARPVLLVDSSLARSILGGAFIDEHWRGWWRRRRARRVAARGGRQELGWVLPNGERVTIDMVLAERYEHGYGPDVGVTEIHGALGVDFLYRWFPLFDLGGRELVLFEFGGQG